MQAYTKTPTTVEELYQAARRGVDERQFSVNGQAILEVNTGQHIRNGTIEVLTGQGWRAINCATPIEYTPRNVPSVVVQVFVGGSLYGTIQYAYPEVLCGRQVYRVEERNPRMTYRFSIDEVRVLEGDEVPPEYR